MTRLLLSTALLALVAGCNGNPGQTKSSSSESGDNGATSPTTAPAPQPSASAKPINKYCAVDRDNPVDPTVTYLYQGQVIGFCCDDCIPKFKKDPEKYMKDLK